MLRVCKFGGSSLCDAAHFLRVREIVLSDTSRRVVVVSAAGKRHSADHKITDLLYLCHAHLRYHVCCHELWRRISGRYLEIRDGCGLKTPIEQELARIYASLDADTTPDALASRGEYLSAQLMADLLGYTFVDAADWLQFDRAGQVLVEASYAALRSLADGRKIVIPGFYGRTEGGALHTLSRGGSDVTGALAAAALGADVYENWTDVDGILAADPAIVSAPRTLPQLSYRELRALSRVGMQVLHESAVEPVRRQCIPLQIRNTARPELAGTLIRCQEGCGTQPDGAVGFAGRRALALLRAELPEEAVPLPETQLSQLLTAHGVGVFHASSGCGEIELLLYAQQGTEALHAAVRELTQLLRLSQVRLRENLAVLAVLYRGANAPSGIADAVQQAGVPVHLLCGSAPCMLLAVNDSQYEAALRAAYQAAFPAP